MAHLCVSCDNFELSFLQGPRRNIRKLWKRQTCYSNYNANSSRWLCSHTDLLLSKGLPGIFKQIMEALNFLCIINLLLSCYYFL